MADIKVVNLQINTNIDNASKEFDDLAKSIKVVDKAATNLDATFEEVYGDLQPLTTRMGEAEDRLYELALAGKQGTKEFKDLLTSVGNYRKVQIQTDMVVDNAATTLSQKLTGSLNAAAGAFSLVQGSMALFGAESDDVEQAILKVQSAMAISQGVETITEGAKSVRALGAAIQSTTIFQKASSAAQYVWNAAMAANPIGLVVASIAALLVGGYKLIKFFKDSSDANEKAASATIKNTNALKQQSISAAQSSNKLKTYNDQQYALAQASGMSSEGLRKLALKHKEEEVALNKKNAVLAQSTFLRQRDTLAALKNSDASDEVIANQEKLVQETYKAFKKQNEILSTSYKERAALRNASKVGEVADEKARLDEITEKNKEAYKKRLEDQKEAAKKAKEQREKDNQAERDFFIGIENTNRERRVTEALDKETANAKVLSDATAVTDALMLEDDKRIQSEQAAADAKKAIQMSTFETAASGLSVLSKLFEKNKALQKASLLAESAIGIAKIIINTQAANAAARLKYSLLPGGVALAAAEITLNKINAGIGIAANLVGTAKGLQALGGGSASGASVGGGGSSAPEPLASAAPTFNVVGTSGQNQIAQSLGNQAPVKAYVVSNDVTTAQSLDRNIVKTATLGN